MTAAGPQLRTEPRQQRARETVTRIKAAALELLSEAGVERFTTNHVAERAGVNISTLYRYFPDKSHLLHALMKDFESRRVSFFIGHLPALDRRESWPTWVAEVVEGLAQIRRQQVGGVAIRRVISAYPDLHALDEESSRSTATELSHRLLEIAPEMDEDTALAMSRVVIATLTHLLDMAFAGDDQGDAAILREAVRMLTTYTP